MARTEIIFVCVLGLAGCGGTDVATITDASIFDSPSSDSSLADSSKVDSSAQDSGALDSSTDTGSDASLSSCARACAVSQSGGCSEFMLVGYSCAAPCGSSSINDLCSNAAPATSEVKCVQTAIAACKADAGANAFPQCSNTCKAYIACLEACK